MEADERCILAVRVVCGEEGSRGPTCSSGAVSKRSNLGFIGTASASRDCDLTGVSRTVPLFTMPLLYSPEDPDGASMAVGDGRWEACYA